MTAPRSEVEQARMRLHVQQVYGAYYVAPGGRGFLTHEDAKSAVDALIAVVRAEERERWADFLDAHKDDLAMGADVVRAGGWFDACVNGAAAIRSVGKP